METSSIVPYPDSSAESSPQLAPHIPLPDPDIPPVPTPPSPIHPPALIPPSLTEALAATTSRTDRVVNDAVAADDVARLVPEGEGKDDDGAINIKRGEDDGVVVGGEKLEEVGEGGAGVIGIGDECDVEMKKVGELFDSEAGPSVPKKRGRGEVDDDDDDDEKAAEPKKDEKEPTKKKAKLRRAKDVGASDEGGAMDGVESDELEEGEIEEGEEVMMNAGIDHDHEADHAGVSAQDSLTSAAPLPLPVPLPVPVPVLVPVLVPLPVPVSVPLDLPLPLPPPLPSVQEVATALNGQAGLQPTFLQDFQDRFAAGSVGPDLGAWREGYGELGHAKSFTTVYRQPHSAVPVATGHNLLLHLHFHGFGPNNTDVEEDLFVCTTACPSDLLQAFVIPWSNWKVVVEDERGVESLVSSDVVWDWDIRIVGVSVIEVDEADLTEMVSRTQEMFQASNKVALFDPAFLIEDLSVTIENPRLIGRFLPEFIRFFQAVLEVDKIASFLLPRLDDFGFAFRLFMQETRPTMQHREGIEELAGDGESRSASFDARTGIIAQQWGQQPNFNWLNACKQLFTTIQDWERPLQNRSFADAMIRTGFAPYMFLLNRAPTPVNTPVNFAFDYAPDLFEQLCFGVTLYGNETDATLRTEWHLKQSTPIYRLMHQKDWWKQTILNLSIDVLEWDLVPASGRCSTHIGYGDKIPGEKLFVRCFEFVAAIDREGVVDRKRWIADRLEPALRGIERAAGNLGWNQSRAWNAYRGQAGGDVLRLNDFLLQLLEGISLAQPESRPLLAARNLALQVIDLNLPLSTDTDYKATTTRKKSGKSARERLFDPGIEAGCTAHQAAL